MKRLLFICLAVLIYFICLFTFDHKPSKVAATTQPAVAALPPANPAQAAKCEKVLEYGQRMGAIKSYESTTDGYGTVVVGPAFYSATFENKQLLDATVRCVLSQGRADYAGLKYISYNDPYTNKEIARWSSVTGFAVE